MLRRPILTKWSVAISKYSILQGVPVLCEHITKTLAEKPKAKDVKVMKEKLEERKRAALKTVTAFTRCVGSDSINQLDALLVRIKGDPVCVDWYNKVEIEREVSGRT